MRYKIILANLIFIGLLSLSACSQQPTIPGHHLETVVSHKVTNTLFYSGTIQPLKMRVVTSPVDGVILEMPFQYGAEVKRGQLLFVLSSTKFLSDYKAALMQYIKTKSEFNSSQTQLSEAKFLHENQLISDDDYTTKQTNFYSNQLSFLQAKDVLENLIRQLDIKDIDLYKLSIAEVDKITQAMHLQKATENLPIVAPVAGAILSPSKNEDEIKKVMKGDAVKQEDVLAVIGDMSGISVRIKVNELTVNQLKLGQRVTVTGIAFPDDVLLGTINRIDKQGEVSNGGLPTFAVEISITKLTAMQQKIIHVGMSAKVAMNAEENSQILIPMQALSEKSGESLVKIYDQRSKKIREVAVRTGKTTVAEVAIVAGLTAGDQLVVPN